MEQVIEQTEQQIALKEKKRSRKKEIHEKEHQTTEMEMEKVEINTTTKNVNAKQGVSGSCIKKNPKKVPESETLCINSKQKIVTNTFYKRNEIPCESNIQDLSELLMNQMELVKNPKEKKKEKRCKERIATIEDRYKNSTTNTQKLDTKPKNNDICAHKSAKQKCKLKIPGHVSERLFQLPNHYNKAVQEASESDPEYILKQIIEDLKKQEARKKKRQYKNVKALERCQRKELIREDEQNGASASTKNLGTKQRSKRKFTETKYFPTYMPREEVEAILKDQTSANGEYVEGCLRINPKFYKHAYLSVLDASDILIIGLRDRNRALEGDIVVARINPPEKWRSFESGIKQKTGVVVCILKEIHSRTAVGYLKEIGNNIQFFPRDQRIPLLSIHKNSLPKQFLRHPTRYKETLFMAEIIQWEKPLSAIGNVLKIIGNTGNLEAETHAILLEHDLDTTPYSENVLKGLPSDDYVLTENDLKDREDWREECVFTIDPATAVDLDDAVSLKVLDNGNFEIGVHIADVTHFFEFLSPLDIEVAKKATTVYLTNNVYHMLPKQLCQVCSLLPGEDKLGFSVIWEMTQKAEIVKHRFAKTVLKSCCQMSYQHAQMFIEENSTPNWPDDFLKIKGNFTVSQLSEIVNTLHKLASQLRNKRYANGALRMDLPKLHVAIDKITGLPTAYSIEEHTDSNKLIEEFMLLANMTVATHLYNVMPETALLRNHRRPSHFILSQVKDSLQKLGVHIEIESAGALHGSLKRYEMGVESDSDEIKTVMKYRLMVINNLCSKSMERATYICASRVEAEEELSHYALNVPFYTHFTSPIRRYSDCAVHRLLYCTMHNVFQLENWSKKLCAQIAENCNVKKYYAKVAQERSSELYFTQLVNLNGSITTLGIVADVKEQSIDVILCKIGIKLRIYTEQLENVALAKYSTEYSVPTIIITWKNPSVIQMINTFTLLHLRVEMSPKLFRLVGFLLPPQDLDLH